MDNHFSTYTLADLLDLPVRHRGITLGHVSDVLLQRHDERPVGLALVSTAGKPAFLPWSALEVAIDEVLVGYPLALLFQTELNYYRRWSRSLVELLEAGTNTKNEPY